MAFPCPTPKKAAYPTVQAASATVRRLHRQGRPGLRAYECACGKWHLTSSPPAGRPR